MTNTDAAEYVQEVTSFPSVQDLLLLSKQSLPESLFLQPALSDTNNQKQGASSIDEVGQTFKPVAAEHPFQPFLQGSLMNGVEFEDDTQRLTTDDLGNSGSMSEDFNPESADVGDISEKRMGEKIVLAVSQGDDNEEHALGTVGIVDSQDGRQTELRKTLEAELPRVLFSINEMPRSFEVDRLILEEERISRESTVSSGEDVLFEGLQFVEPLRESPVNGTVNLGWDGVSIVEGLAEMIEESGGVEVEIDDVAIRESLNNSSKESNSSQGSNIDFTLSNGTHKIETLGEILSRDRKEKGSWEVGKGTGEKTSSSQIISSGHASIVADSMGSTSKGYQGNGDSVPPRDLIPAPVVNADGSSSSATNIVGDILYNIAVGDEEGRSRQRILAFAAKRYAANVERDPKDHDALYNWALVLQETADNAGPEVGSPGKDALLQEACKKYEAATQLCPTLHEAYYNWAIAISDRAKIRGRTKEAEDLWKQACDRYDRAVQLNWNSPQALNNWGLALQELGAIAALKEKRSIVKKAIRKFRAAIRLRFDFHRAVYNLGTVLYGLGEDIARTGRRLTLKELTPADLNSLSAIYITAAHALKPDYPVYRGALRLVRNFLPLPYLKAGWLRIPPTGDSLAPHSDWLRLWFVLDHEALYEMKKVDRKFLAHSYSKRASTRTSESNTSSSLASRPSVLRIEMENIFCLAPTADLSLPPGGGFCIHTDAGPQHLIADTWNGMDAWVDAIRLVYTIYSQGKRNALANVLVV